MPRYSIFQIDHDNLDPAHRQAAVNARLGAIQSALEADMHKLTGTAEVDSMDELLDLDPDMHQPLFFGDVVCDPVSCDTYVFTTCGLEVLTWARAEAFILRSIEAQEVVVAPPIEERMELA